MPRYIIYMQLISGEVIKAFTWRGIPELGIIRAKSEGRPFLKVWASSMEDFQ